MIYLLFYCANLVFSTNSPNSASGIWIKLQQVPVPHICRSSSDIQPLFGIYMEGFGFLKQVQPQFNRKIRAILLQTLTSDPSSIFELYRGWDGYVTVVCRRVRHSRLRQVISFIEDGLGYRARAVTFRMKLPGTTPSSRLVTAALSGSNCSGLCDF